MTEISFLGETKIHQNNYDTMKLSIFLGSITSSLVLSTVYSETPENRAFYGCLVGVIVFVMIIIFVWYSVKKDQNERIVVKYRLDYNRLD